MKFCPCMTFCTNWLSVAMEVPLSQGAVGDVAWPVGEFVLVGPAAAVVPVVPVAEVDEVDVPSLAA